MNVDEYIQSRETEYCRTTTSTKDAVAEQTTLVCTDSRLIHSKRSEITDIRLQNIDVIRFSPRPIKWGYVAAAAVLGFLALVGPMILGDIPVIPDLPDMLVHFVFGVLAVGFAADAIRAYKPTLEIHTGSDSYEFRGGDLEDFPHAIRGAS